MKNYYQILGVSDSAEQNEIRKAYLKKAKEFHPDINKSSVAEAKFKEVQEAYIVLSDIDKKASYDYNRQFYTYQNPYQNASEWADYFRQQAEQQKHNQQDYQNKQQNPANNNTDEFNFEGYDDHINNQSTLFVFLLFLALFIMAVVIYYAGFWSSFVLGGMLYLLYQMYQGSKNTS